MKRSRRVVLLMMGAAAVAGSGPALAVGPCGPIDPRLLTPAEAERRRLNCVRPGGFGVSGHRVHHYFHGPGG